MPFEVTVSDVHSFPGIGWDTRPRYSSRTLVGHWDEERSDGRLLSGQAGRPGLTGSQWASTSQTDFSRPLSLATTASSARTDSLSQSLTNRRQHESVHNSLTMVKTAPPAVFKHNPQTFDPAIRRGKIPSMTGTRSYNRFTCRWEPEPIDSAPSPVKSTRLRDSLRKKWAEEAAVNRKGSYTTTVRESYKRLPPIQPNPSSSFKRSAVFSNSHLPHILSRDSRVYK